MARVAFDGPGAAVEQNLLDHLTGPYAGASRRVRVPLDAEGEAAVDWTSRHPVLLAVLLEDLGEEAVEVAVTIEGEGQRPVEFAPWSEAGASLPVFVPDTAAQPLVPVFAVAVETRRGADVVTGVVELAVVEGNLGRLLYLLGQEKVRLRRAAREVHAYRTLDLARRDALDRIGADLGVTRFDDQLVYDEDAGEVYARHGARESDVDYALRLGMYRRFLAPSPGAVTRLLDGLFADLPGGARPALVETDDRFAVAIHLVGVGGAQHRDNFLTQLRRDRLVLPAPQANGIHQGRRLSARRLAEIEALRARLRAGFVVAAAHALAPPLAHALDRVARVCAAIGFGTRWTIQRAQDAAAGSRYQLGLGVDIAVPTSAQAADVRARVLDEDREPGRDTTAEALVTAIRAAGVPAAGDDPELAWLWHGCGLATVHRLSTGSLYLSHLPTGGLAITGPATAAPGSVQQLSALFHAPGDPGGNALLVRGLAAAGRDWADRGETPWTTLTDAAARTRWGTVPVRPAGQPVHQAFAAAGLPSIVDPGPVVTALTALPEELVETIELDAAFSGALVAGQPAAVDRLTRLVAVLRANGIAAALPLADNGSRVLLVVSVIGLPGGGLNLAERRATGFRWYLVRLGGADGEIKAVGSRTILRAADAGLLAVVVVSYQRAGNTDPYEFRVELPDGAVLTLAQYERLMNALRRVHPIGVEVNTYAIRRDHVDLDGDGTAEPLLPAVAKTFRTYQRRTRSGVYE
ncbi:MAG: hypothetical protein WBA97_13740 [Actinophytocola sp.]|uniref:hypothetical protein n=1 Tax=Actinophytocola sp. TaxID=1872138 RepID=UPI003C74B911